MYLPVQGHMRTIFRSIGQRWLDRVFEGAQSQPHSLTFFLTAHSKCRVSRCSLGLCSVQLGASCVVISAEPISKHLVDADPSRATCLVNDAEAGCCGAEGLRSPGSLNHHVCSGFPLQSTGSRCSSSVLCGTCTAAKGHAYAHATHTCGSFMYSLFTMK